MATPSVNANLNSHHSHPQVNQQPHHHAVSNNPIHASLYGSATESSNPLLPANNPSKSPSAMYGQAWQNSPLPPAYNAPTPNASSHANPYAGNAQPAGNPAFSEQAGQFPQSQPPFQQYEGSPGHGTAGFHPHAGLSSYGSGSTVAPNSLLRSNQMHAGASNLAQSRPQNSPLGTGAQRTPSHGGQPQAPSTPEATQSSRPPIVPPTGTTSGEFNIISAEDLARVVQSQPYFPFANVVAMAAPPRYHAAKIHLPKYEPRKSRNELRSMNGGDPKTLAKINKRSSSKKKSTKVSVPKSAAVKAAMGDKGMVDISDTTDDSSDYESDSEYESEDEEPCPNPTTRPDEPLGATRFDTVEAVWQPGNVRYRPLEVVRIRKGVRDFWEVVKTIRDRWKSDQQDLKGAESAKKVKDIPLFKSRVKTQLQMMQVSLEAAWEHGHPDIVSVMGDVVPFLATLYTLLVDRNKESDYTGPLVMSIFKLLTRCTALTVENMEKSKLKNAISRFLKMGNDEVKDLAKKVNEVAERNAKTKSGDGKPTADVNPVSESKANLKPDLKDSPVKSAAKPASPDPVAGVKRRQADAGTTQPQKKVAAGTAPSAAASTSAAKPGAAPVKKTLASNGDKKPAGPTPAAKPVGHKVTPKPVNMFAGLTASKRTGAAAADKKKPGTAAKPVSSFSQLMRDLSTPKETTTASAAKAEEQQKPETDEEKTKRLRKEQRRALRVSFKPDSELVQIRFFTHDPEEEIGHDASMVRDVSDVGGEGRMFKQHKDQMETEDDDLPKVEDLGSWTAALPIDFSELDEKSRKDNALTRGGTTEGESEETKARKEHCNNTLIAIYADRDDIPETPQSPTQKASDAHMDPPTEVGTPPDFVLERAARVTGKPWPPPGESENAQPPGVAGSNFLEQIFNQFSTPARQEPPQAAPQPAAQPAANASANIADILAALQGNAAAAPAQPAYSPPAAPASNPTPALDPQIASLLAQINQQSAAQPQQPQQQPSNYNSWDSYGQDASSSNHRSNDYSGGQQHQSGPYENPDRKRHRENDRSNRDRRPSKRNKDVQYDEHEPRSRHMESSLLGF